MLSKKKYPLMEIVWDDITSHHAWDDIEETEKDTPVRAKSIGWKIRGNKTCITLATMLSVDEEGRVGERVTIPKGCIRYSRRIE